MLISYCCSCCWENVTWNLFIIQNKKRFIFPLQVRQARVWRVSLLAAHFLVSISLVEHLNNWNKLNNEEMRLWNKRERDKSLTEHSPARFSAPKRRAHLDQCSLNWIEIRIYLELETIESRTMQYWINHLLKFFLKKSSALFGFSGSS